MKRLIGSTLALIVVLAAPGAALAARPDADCPVESSGYALVDQQTWWDRTVAGFEAEDISVYVGGDPANGFTAEFDAFAAAFGLGDGQGLYDFVWIAQWAMIDKNEDLTVCMKDRPITKGNPAYFFNGVDNTAN